MTNVAHLKLLWGPRLSYIRNNGFEKKFQFLYYHEFLDTLRYYLYYGSTNKNPCILWGITHNIP